MTETPKNDAAFPVVFEKEDYIHDGMSLREYAAIKLKVPESGTDWLDDMIRKSLRDELAMSVSVEDPGYAYHSADKFLAARGGDK